jgi:EAL domain-containing protein (putative c-di-GMP-specific phosphodiesterase class I)
MLGANVLRKACQRAAQWPSPIRVAVNLSARQFQSGDLVALVSETLRVAGLPASRLELEITETILVADNARTVAILNALRGLGVQIALDDFGTGYSSLSYLTSFPFDRIKIDRSFVADLATRRDAAAIVRAVTQLAAELGMATTAEGVETASDLEWLSRHGCGQAQGFLFSAPVSADQFEALLRAAPQTPGSVAA